MILLLAALLAWPADAAFYAAAGKVDITPDASKRVWLAGYGAKGRRAAGVHDPLYARAVVVSDGARTVAVVAVDLIGLFHEDVQEARRRLGWTGGPRYLFVSATHTHSGPDTVGMWGPLPGVSGVNARYRERVLDSIAGLVRDLSGRMVEAELAFARADVDPRGLCRDIRDPVVIDPELDVLRLRDRRTKAAIGTVVRFSCHPEVLERRNNMITADYPGPLCARVEKDGGACVFLPGAIGGMMTPDVDHSRGTEFEFAETERVGKELAELALAALRRAGPPETGTVSYSSASVRVPVENSRYLIFLRNLTFGHKITDPDGRPVSAWRALGLTLRHLARFPLPESRRPWVETEVSLIRLGGVALLGVPGEMFPETALGGYDGRYRFGYPVTGPANPNPPDLSKAPRGPYLRARLPAKAMLVGLANDELGYFVPDYDFQVAPNRSMSPQPAGTHYEETNSTGPRAERIIVDAATRLLGR